MHPLLEAWERCWSPHPQSIAEEWSRAASACTFVPFDAGSIVHGRHEIATHLARRAAAQRLERADWTLLAEWRTGELQLVIAGLELVTRGVPGEPAESRAMRFLAAGESDGPRLRLRHVTEAMPAVLVEAIGAYERHAREGARPAGPPGARE